MHVVLLGDSIFDNLAYAEGGPDVVTYLNRYLAHPGKATLLARDGARIRDVAAQTRDLPEDASHLFVSMGGNDALSAAHLLHKPAASIAEGLARFEQPLATFENAYIDALQVLCELALPVTVCTIYNGAFPVGLERTSTTIAVRLFNDLISSLARSFGIPVLELRSVCTEESDYWNPIEPSASGGAKIAAAVASAL